MIIVFLFYKKDKKDIIIVMNKQKSFTLIELLVVIVIIGILAGVITISTSSSIDKANIAKSKVFEESVQNNLAAHMVSAWDADHVTKGVTWVLNDKWGNNNGTFYDNTSTACTTSLCPQIVADNQMGNVLSFDGVYDYVLASSVNFLTYSGEYTFIETEMYWPVNHMVAPKEQSLSCAECHTRTDSRLATLNDFYLPGRDRHAGIDIMGKLMIFGALLGVIIHAILRFIVAIKNKEIESQDI